MKKLLSLLFSVVLAFSFLLVGCNKETKESFTFYAPDGAPALAIAEYIVNNEDFGTEKTFNYNIVSSLEISTAITVEKADFVILPINSATKLYNADKDNLYSLVSVITHGNFYLISSFNIESASDLKNKVILMPNATGTVPDLTLKAIFDENSIEYVESDSVVSGKVAISYKGSGSAVIGSMPVSGSETFVAMLPEPASSTLMTKKSIYSYKGDVQALFDSENKSYPQAVLLAKNSTLENFPEIVNEMANSFAFNVQWTKSNSSRAVEKIKEVFGATTLSTSITTSSIEGCNIYWSGAKAEKQNILNYINRIKAISPNSISEVDDTFFYNK